VSTPSLLFPSFYPLCPLFPSPRFIFFLRYVISTWCSLFHRFSKVPSFLISLKNSTFSVLPGVHSVLWSPLLRSVSYSEVRSTLLPPNDYSAFESGRCSTRRKYSSSFRCTVISPPVQSVGSNVLVSFRRLPFLYIRRLDISNGLHPQIKLLIGTLRMRGLDHFQLLSLSVRA